MLYLDDFIENQLHRLTTFLGAVVSVMSGGLAHYRSLQWSSKKSRIEGTKRETEELEYICDKSDQLDIFHLY